jgi:hypothetical protein
MTNGCPTAEIDTPTLDDVSRLQACWRSCLPYLLIPTTRSELLNVVGHTDFYVESFLDPQLSDPVGICLTMCGLLALLLVHASGCPVSDLGGSRICALLTLLGTMEKIRH